MGIFGGSYHIPPEELEKFHKLYEEHVIQKKNHEYLTEKQINETFVVDLDFCYNTSITSRQHTKENIQKLIKEYVLLIGEYCIRPKNKLQVCIMEKPTVNILEDKTKDGIHIIITNAISRKGEHKIQQKIRERMIEILSKEDSCLHHLPLINSWEDVLDKGITEGTTNWQLYGSRKPGNEAYELTGVFRCEIKSCNEYGTPYLHPVVEIEDCYAKFISGVQNGVYNYLDFLSIQNDSEICECKVSTDSIRLKNSTQKRTFREITPNTAAVELGDGLTMEEELLYMIRIDPKDRPVWLWICSCIKYNNMTNEHWEKFGELNDLNWDTEKENLFDYCRTDSKNNNIYSLQCYAKKNNPEQYKIWLNKWNVYQISAEEVKDPFACSKVIYSTLQHTLRLSKENWFMLQKNNLWKSQREPSFFIVEEMHKYLDCGRNRLNEALNNAEGDEKDKLTDRLKNWMGFYTLVSSNSYISGLTRFLRTQLVDDKFPERLDCLTGKLAFQNGIMDLETKIFREGIRWDDYLTETIPHDYSPVENTDFVREKLKLIVNNNEEQLEYHLSVFGFSFIGMPELIKSVIFHIDKTDGGRGDNGKSFFFDILHSLMPNYVYRSKSSFLDKNNKTIHKQISQIKGKRLVFLEEMPKKQAMNHSLFKEIGDGNSIENEIMYGTCETIKVQCLLHALSNHIPDLSAEEEACYNRYRQISYNSHFDRTGTRTEENIAKLEFIADETLKDSIKTDYAAEVFNLIIDYAHKFFVRGKKLPAIPAQFSKDTKETKAANDKFGVWFDENLEVAVDGKVPEKKILYELNLNNIYLTEKELRKRMKDKGFVYNADLRGMGVNDQTGKHHKGGYEGVEEV